jgi:hypothetical protein
MSYIPLSEVKDFLNVIGTAEDDKLQLLLNGAEQSALDFMNRNSFAEICEEDSNYDSDSATMPDNVRVGVYFLIQKYYHATPDDAMLLQKVAEQLLMPYRCEMGI